MDSHEGDRIATALARRVGKSADVAHITDAIVSIWQEIDDALSPVIGRRGVAALYKRSLYMTALAYPWLTGVHERVATSIDFAALKSSLARQSGADAVAGGGTLLRTFCDLLATLIGLSLTERLLRSVWTNSSSGPPAKDALP